MIETIQPPQPLQGLLIPKIVVPVREAEVVPVGPEVLPVTYMKLPPAVDLVMEAEISDHRDPLQTDTKTHLMDGSLEVRGRTEVKQPLKGKIYSSVISRHYFFFSRKLSFVFTKKKT